MSESDLDDLLTIAVNLIIRILGMEDKKEVAFKGKTKEELESWLEEERLGKRKQS